MARIESEDLNKLKVSELNQHGYFRGGWALWTITWTGAYSGINTKVNFEILFGEITHLRAYYTDIDPNTQEKISLDYRISLTTTPCHYGGKRFWFVCPSHYCGKRVGVLYRYGKYFMCRHCCRLTYASKNLSGRHKGRMRIISFPEIEASRAKVRRVYYRGKMTKNYRRYLCLERRGYTSFNTMSEWIMSKRH